MTPTRPRRHRAAVAAAVHYRVQAPQPQNHLFTVRLSVAAPARRQRLSLPVWIPGSYLVREFSQHLQQLRATQAGMLAPLKQVDKHSWVVEADPGQPLELDYEIYALDASVRTAWLDSQRGFFNGTSLCLRVVGQEDQPHALTLDAGDLPASWQVATGLTPQDVDDRGWGRYGAADYDELVDAPVEMGPFWSGEFTAGGVPHRFVVSGAPASFDGQRLLDDTQRICVEQIRFWHGDQRPPFERYVFMLHATADGYGGLEHRNSTALICQRSDLPRATPKGTRQTPLKATDGYTTLLGLISHEYFHTWNVKRLRPAEFTRYDYDCENYTELLWFFEGFTSYYDDLFLRRAGLIDDSAYLQLIARTVNQVLQTPGRDVQSVAQASFDAWVKYYRVNENTPNATVSYYTKGSLVALCLDLTLRQEGHGSLDEVMRELWRRSDGGPIRERDIAQALRRIGGRSFQQELASWVHGTEDLPLITLLRSHGTRVELEAAPLPQQLGLRIVESNHGLLIKSVLRRSAAEAAGFSAGDEWIGIEQLDKDGNDHIRGWRVTKLEELTQLMSGGDEKVIALVARDRQLMRLPLRLPAGTVQSIRIHPGSNFAASAALQC